jgi:3-hydroxyacyl-[acyl-carrier-protein] dehydratase
MDKLEEVKAAIPHREPFLFIDEIVECEGNRILCKKTFRADEFFFTGHYPDFPVVPGVLQCEAAMQAGAILLTRIFKDEDLSGRVPVVTKLGNVRFKQMIHPGDTLLFDVEFKNKMAGIYFLHAKVTIGDKTAAHLDIACALTKMSEGL